MHCPFCGASADARDNFCRDCGCRLAHPQACTTKAAPIRDRLPEAQQKRNRRFMARMRAACVAIVMVALLLVVLGQVAPGLFNGSAFTPKDLGVKWSEKDYNSIVDKCGVPVDTPPDGTDKSRYTDVYIGSKDISWSFTECELTALFNGSRQPGYWPISDVQIKLHPGNSMEASFMLDPKKLLTYPVITRSLPQEIKAYIANIPLKIPVYAKLKVTFTGPKQADITMQSLSISGISAPDLALGEQANQMLESILGDILSDAEPVSITSFSTNEGTLVLKGTWYKELQRIPIE